LLHANERKYMDECSAVLTGLSILGGTFLGCLTILLIVATAIGINKLLRAYWVPVRMVRYIDTYIHYDDQGRPVATDVPPQEVTKPKK
jgi:hypothetical protein